MRRTPVWSGLHRLQEVETTEKGYGVAGPKTLGRSLKRFNHWTGGIRRCEDVNIQLANFAKSVESTEHLLQR